MSLYGALYAGVAGLQAQSNKLGIISDNVANVNTIGYKQGLATFETLVTNASNATAYSPGGVLGSNQQQVSTQGLLQSTSSPTDIAIQGSGLFVVNQTSDQTGQVMYTRAGSFTADNNGNFVNTAGFFLQAWPLDSNGLLPGAPGNSTNTTSSANLSSLKTVNVQGLTGTATASTQVSLSANLNSGQTSALGSGVTAIMDAKDPINSKNAANDLIVPTGVDSLTIGDVFNVQTGSASVKATYTYGGFSFSRSVDAPSTTGDSGAALPAETPPRLASIPLTFTAGSKTVVVHADPTVLGLQVGTVINFAGTTGANGLGLDGLSGIDGRAIVTATNGSSDFTITLPTATATPAATVIPNTATFSVAGASASPTTVSLTFASLPAGMKTGDTITLANSPTITGSGITGAMIDGAHVITVAGNVVTFTTANAAGAAGSVAPGVTSTYFDSTGTFAAGSTATYSDSMTVNSATNLPTGYILDAKNETDAFLGTTGVSTFTPSSLNFTINTPATGTVTFTYTAAAPNTQLGQFNNLTNLATAINNITGLTARIANGRLFVGALDANASVIFSNGSDVGTAGPPIQAGIDWVGELGLQNVPASSTITPAPTRFNSLGSLATDINNTSGLSAITLNSAADSSMTINAADPLDTVTFTDGPVSGTNNNTGSPLAALGITGITSYNSAAVDPLTPRTTGSLGPAYDPLDKLKNMASGNTPAQFNRPITIYDSLGAAHNINIAFLKTNSNTWAVEVFSQPGTDVTNPIDGSNIPGPSDGLIAAGQITFSGDGTLRTVDPTLLNPIVVGWNDSALTSSITINWGTDGKTDGLSQFDSGYIVNSVHQNGTPVGQLTGVSIDSSGFITASFNNGQTQKLYKIPLAEFTSPDNLQSASGNAFTQTSGSGEVNLKEAGTSGVGNISSGALETSNVELANQLTDMIVAQRAYQANTKVISTADQLLQALDQIIQ